MVRKLNSEVAVKKSFGLYLLVAGVSIFAQAAAVTQNATLKDLKTVGSTDKKQKYRQYDLILDTPTNEYICRSKLGKTVKPTEFVVGSTVQFKLNGQNGEATNTMGNTVKCGIVRVAVVPPAQY
jgi:DNA topoisomerase VI subunit B